ncbi:eukaryotic translation initiation factor (eiF3 delta) [Theileria annulata]|uniref:Eukaryotic translation initiation factor 3 subunit G n=1 Tax=Theileria annulata TaxID=5874 RepID=Q4UGQ0_THEAN|nr:eukaryotic translation initiation factor (eiF3 delta) [Theileria annulata]CAI73739.1 eukaryotic translation initiation factor (eiF3 delta homologue), putative [Theileria annulata]|eukprot:XP_954416.1 eukaryotic translation initiation factor (eiF3 delta homologue), putative [Theileria annulata]
MEPEDNEVENLIELDHLKEFEIATDSQGIKSLVSYSRNSRGHSVKITKRVKEIVVSKRIHKSVFERKNLVPFNLNDENDAGANFVSNEEIVIELSRNERRLNQDDDSDLIYSPVDTNFLKLSRDLKLKFKSLKEEDNVPEEVEEEPPAKYVPPSRKEGGERRSFDDNTIRITNLSEDIREKDLTELFGRVGRIHRAYLAKYKETQNPKGFAFVTYVNKEDAREAINKFNRWGYNNLLLNVEWARPSKDK